MTAPTTTTWETVIGLEVHVELSTATKLFCSCKNEFGAEPNTNICPVCLGLPGSLPVLNERAVEFALRVGEALQCTVPERSLFHRKNYFYPDMPKDYQISQYDEPICIDGSLEVDGARIGIERAHMEEDTGKTIHVGGGGRIHEAAYSLVDYNRAGIPLMEVVSRPDIRSTEQARAYVNELRAVLLAIEVSEVRMEEGAFRIDANVSMRPEGRAELGTKVEIKNMNSLRSLGRALEYEIDRQCGLLDAGERVVQETRHWDESAGVTHTMRTKEEADDYRYFPEPDLVPVAPDETMRQRAREWLPELPAARRARLIREWGITAQDARVLVDTIGLADFAEAAAAALRHGTLKDVVNWCTGDLLAYVHETGLAPAALRLTPDALAELIDLVADGTLSRNQAKDVLAEPLRTGKRPKQVVEERGLAQVSDEGELTRIVDEVIASHPDVVAEYRSGDDKTRKKKRGFLMGEAMKATKGQGNPQLLNRLLDEHLS
jgi:aspartyl-tRNA(Asn)/glutamyl-tRNA(Gln) amidotransferase subunit B